MHDLWKWTKEHKLLVLGGLGGLIVFYLIYKYMAGSSASSAAAANLAEQQALLNAGVPTTTQVQAQQVADQAAIAAQQEQDQTSLAASGIGAQEQATAAGAQVATTTANDQLTASLAQIQAAMTASNDALLATQTNDATVYNLQTQPTDPVRAYMLEYNQTLLDAGTANENNPGLESIIGNMLEANTNYVYGTNLGNLNPTGSLYGDNLSGQGLITLAQANNTVASINAATSAGQVYVPPKPTGLVPLNDPSHSAAA